MRGAAGLDGLGSTGELVMGQAGQLVQALRQHPEPGRPLAVLAAKVQPADHAEDGAAAWASIGDLFRAVAAGATGIPPRMGPLPC